MRARITKLLAGLAALSALAVGGATLASASSKAPPAPAPAATVDNGNVQQGDQSAPDTAGAAEQGSESSSSESATEQSPASEQASESASEVAGNDGPGGHADEPGNPNADHQFDGQE